MAKTRAADTVDRPAWRERIERACGGRAGRLALGAAAFEPTGMHSFATLHPRAAFWLVAEDRERWTLRRHGKLDVVECGPRHLPELMARHRG